MQKIQVHLWYDRQAGEAIRLYTSLFHDSGILSHSVLEGTPSGDADVYSFRLAGQQFQAINGGPYFRHKPACSLAVACESRQEVDRLHQALSKGGGSLIPLGEQPFNPWYAWIEDKWGLSWQLILMDKPAQQKITPCLLFSGAQAGQAEEAARHYMDVFGDAAQLLDISRYQPGEAPSPDAKTRLLLLALPGLTLSAMDSGMPGDIPFNEAFSLIVNCLDQAELDRYWHALSAHPEAEQCGWLKDRYGLSWQIVPANMDELLQDEHGALSPAAMQAMLQMKKIDIEGLRKAR